MQEAARRLQDRGGAERENKGRRKLNVRCLRLSIATARMMRGFMGPNANSPPARNRGTDRTPGAHAARPAPDGAMIVGPPVGPGRG